MIALQSLRDLLPPSLLSKLSVRHKLDATHEIRLPGEVAFVCLLNSLLNHPLLTQRLLEEEYVKQTGKSIDHSTFSRWLARTNAALFRALFAYLYAKLADKATQGEVNALRLRFVDATIVTLSAKLLTWGLRSASQRKGSTRRQVKSVFELSDAGFANLLHVCKEQAELADNAALGPTLKQATQPGDLWVFDRGCHSRERLLDIHTAQGFFLTPHHQQGYRVLQGVQENNLNTADLPPLLPKTDSGFRLVRVEQVIFQNSYKNDLAKRLQAMPLLLVHGFRFDQRSKSWKPLVLMTNLPLSEDQKHAGPFTFLQVAELYKRRWEIEVFFKFLKQHLSYKHLTSRTENGVLVMTYMSLIMALLLIWYKRQTCIDRGWRSVKFWFAEDAREWTQIALQTVFLQSG